MMDVCCGLGTVSLAGRALTEAARATAPDERRGFQVATCVSLLGIAEEQQRVISSSRAAHCLTRLMA